jgi:predicted transcriptional regulator
MSENESTLNIKTTAMSSELELESWRNKKILEGIAESENKDYADEESVKQIFKKTNLFRVNKI